jgi:hypothetical protein
MKINKRYLPKMLTKKDKNTQYKELIKSRRLYKKGKYYTRRKMPSFIVKKSPHVIAAEKMYNVDKIVVGAEVNPQLVKATGCSKEALAKIINKGEGAYFSSGSRPNQTAQSWGYARLGSAITGQKAAAVDYSIIESGCKKSGKAYKLAKQAKQKYGSGHSRTRKISV